MTPTHSPFSLSFSPSLCLRCVAAASPCRSLRHCACAASARQGRQDLKAALRTMQENLSARHGEAQASLEDSHTRALAAQQDSHQRDLVALEDRHRQVPPPCLETGRMQASRRTNHAHHSFHPPPGRSCWPSRHSTGTRCGASTPPRCGAARHHRTYHRTISIYTSSTSKYTFPVKNTHPPHIAHSRIRWLRWRRGTGSRQPCWRRHTTARNARWPMILRGAWLRWLTNATACRCGHM